MVKGLDDSIEILIYSTYRGLWLYYRQDEVKCVRIGSKQRKMRRAEMENELDRTGKCCNPSEGKSRVWYVGWVMVRISDQ